VKTEKKVKYISITLSLHVSRFTFVSFPDKRRWNFMKFAKVIGNVVCTQKDENCVGWKLLIIQPVDLELKPKGETLVAVDAVGAGDGELVLFVSGSSARQTDVTKNKPCDCVIAAIVDTVEKEGDIIFKKFETEGYR